MKCGIAGLFPKTHPYHLSVAAKHFFLYRHTYGQRTHITDSTSTDIVTARLTRDWLPVV